MNEKNKKSKENIYMRNIIDWLLYWVIFFIKYLHVDTYLVNIYYINYT